MKSVFAALSLTCALASQATPGFSTANAFSSGTLISSVSLGSQSEVRSSPFGSNFSYDMKVARPDGTFASVQVSCQPSTIVGTYEARYRCAYGVKPGLSVFVVPPSSLTANFVSMPATQGGTFSVTGASTQPNGFAMIGVAKSGLGTTAAALTGSPVPWELDNGSWPQFSRSQIRIDFAPGASFKTYSVGSDPGQTTIGGITYGVHEEVLFISYHPAAGEAKVTNSVNVLGFVRDNDEGVTVWSEDYVKGAMIDVLAVGPSAWQWLHPAVNGVLQVDLSAPILVVGNDRGGCLLSTPLGYTVSTLLDGYRSQMFRLDASGVSALSFIDW